MDLERLTHPEYLSSQELKDVLQSYNIPVTDDMARCEILELFRKNAQPLPQRENHSQDGTNSRSYVNVNNEREQEMEIDDNELCPKRSKFSPQSVHQLGNKLQNIVRISDCYDSHKPINIEFTLNNRKRQSTSQFQRDNDYKSRKLSETY